VDARDTAFHPSNGTTKAGQAPHFHDNGLPGFKAVDVIDARPDLRKIPHATFHRLAGWQMYGGVNYDAVPLWAGRRIVAHQILSAAFQSKARSSGTYQSTINSFP
jgi:hypothetical protein